MHSPASFFPVSAARNAARSAVRILVLMPTAPRYPVIASPVPT